MVEMRRCSQSVRVWRATSALTAHRLASMFETPGKRDEEAFLYQYDPMEVLGLPKTTNDLAQVKDAFNKVQMDVGPNSKKPNKQRMERAQKAFDMLMDHESVYYRKSTMSDKHRRELMLQVMPRGVGLLAQANVGLFTILVIMGVFSFFYVMCYPMIKISRAASRGLK
jgi:preprotein translocase subunit Sec63